MNTCNTCNGSKTVKIGMDTTHTKTCPACKGKGNITIKQRNLSIALKNGDYPMFEVF